MLRRYELWLDESGQFENEKMLQQRSLKPSLIGGLLIRKENADKVDLDHLIDSSRNHAMHLADADKREYVLPVLECMQQTWQARQIIFENAEYEEEDSNRQLYLRMMAEGLLQLLQTLNAETESVILDVLIARRQDMRAMQGRREIREIEYIRALKEQIAVRKKNHRIFLDRDSELRFAVRPAGSEPKLQIADFVCNTRLTRDSKAFENVRDRVDALYENACIFSMSELSSANYIKRCLVQGNLSDAMMELYTTEDAIDRDAALGQLKGWMAHTSYHLVKAQINQSISDIMTYAACTEDFEVGEDLLRRIAHEWIPVLRSQHLPYKKFELTLLIRLTDMYLEEGDILAAGRAITRCREVQKTLGNRMENLKISYQLAEAEAKLAIKSFDFESAGRIMAETGESMRHILRAVGEDGYFGGWSQNVRSSYYGDILGIQIEAMLPLQRREPDSYTSLCRLSDLAMSQYPEIEGELERHQMLRSRIEMLQGDCKKALGWLMRAAAYPAEDLSVEGLKDFLDHISDSENIGGCMDYLMHYLLIMAEAGKQRENFADTMYQALKKQQRLMQAAGLSPEYKQSFFNYEVDIEDVKEEDTGIAYHPQEIIDWQYALVLTQKERFREAQQYYKKALDICFRFPNYHTLWITGIGIMADDMICMKQAGDQTAVKELYEKMLNRLETLCRTKLPETTMQLVQQLQKKAGSCRNRKGEWMTAPLKEIVSLIGY